jgi:hypothetical protein
VGLMRGREVLLLSVEGRCMMMTYTELNVTPVLKTCPSP